MAHFENTEPSRTIVTEGQPSLLRDVLLRRGNGAPPKPVQLVTPTLPEPAAPLAATWLGHASVLIEIAGRRVLADPVWSKRCSPVQFAGPARLHDVPLALVDLPVIDAVVISHDHYDHLDKATIVALAATQKCQFFVPTAVAAYLIAWGVPRERIVELGWGEAASCGELEIRCVAARHFSGRTLTRNTTLWASWIIRSGGKSVYFGGDTGFTQHFRTNAEQFGPFDLTLLPIGAYDPRWPDIHLNPEEAVQAWHELAGGERPLFVPIHWATFNLAFHAWAEPVERLIKAAAPAEIPLALPRPGERIDVDSALSELVEWWV